MNNIREVIARALYGCGWNIEKWPESDMQDAFLLRADVVLSAIEAAGMRVVPEEPTPEMFEAGDEAWLLDDDAADIYRAMLAATR